MRSIKKVPIGNVIIDRIPLSRKTLRYANLLKNGAVFPPIKCMKLGNGMYAICDGRHRFTAHKLNNVPTITIKTSEKINEFKEIFG